MKSKLLSIFILGVVFTVFGVDAFAAKVSNAHKNVNNTNKGRKKPGVIRNFNQNGNKSNNQEPRECRNLRRRIVHGADDCVRATSQQQKEQHCDGCLDGKNAVNEAQSKGCDLNGVLAQVTDIRENFGDKCADYLDSQVNTPAQTQHEQLGF